MRRCIGGGHGPGWCRTGASYGCRLIPSVMERNLRARTGVRFPHHRGVFEGAPRKLRFILLRLAMRETKAVFEVSFDPHLPDKVPVQRHVCGFQELDDISRSQ
jgi:hypothetical protein